MKKLIFSSDPYFRSYMTMQKFQKMYKKTYEELHTLINYLEQNNYKNQNYNEFVCDLLIHELKGIKVDLYSRQKNYSSLKKEAPWLIKEGDDRVKERFKSILNKMIEIDENKVLWS